MASAANRECSPIDDQFAVAYALRSPEHMTIEAVYAAPFLNERCASPGDGMRKSYEEILRILARLGRNPQGFAFAGSDRFCPAAAQPVDSPAARDLIAKALQPRPGPLYVITVGAPTNVSSALLLEPRIKDRIVVVWLGGQPYDWPTAREFNLFQDLHSSRVLYDSGVALVNTRDPRSSAAHPRPAPSAADRANLPRSQNVQNYFCHPFINFREIEVRNPASAP